MPSYWLIVPSENDHVFQLTAVSASEEARTNRQQGKQNAAETFRKLRSAPHQDLASSGSPQKLSLTGNVFLKPFQEFESFHGRGFS